jgi:serine/threonine-protein kinase
MKTILLYVTVVLVSAVTAIGTSLVSQRSSLFSRADEPVVVPNLVGISEADARANLRALGFVLLVGPRKPMPDAEPDTVIAQSIPAGQSVPRGAAITVSFARAMPKVPNLVGQSLQEATALLGKQELTLEQGEPVASNEVAAGRIVSQTPLAGVARAKAQPVVVRVSSGPGEATVPKLLGQPVNKAKEALKAAGLELGPITWLDQGETPVDVVLNQHPVADTKVKPGEKVRITVNH